MNIGRTISIHGTIAVVALVAAYFAWTHDRGAEEGAEEEDAPQVVVAEISPGDLKGVSYRGEKRRVEIELASDEEGAPTWITVTTRTKVPRPRTPTKTPTETPTADGGASDGSIGADGGVVTTGHETRPEGGPNRSSDGGVEAGVAVTDGGAPEEEEPEYRDEVMRFVANENLDEIIKTLAPLKAVRRLGKLSNEQREEFELADTEASLELKLTDGVRRFEIGARTFGAGSHYYVLDGESGEAYLFGSKLIRDLEMAQSRLMQRELHRFEPADAATAVITSGSRRLEMSHQNRHSQQDREWSPTESSGGGSKVSSNWMRQIERLRALAYPGPEDDFSVEGASPVLRIEYKDEDGSELGFVEIVKALSAPPEFFCRSEATGTFVRLSRSVTEQLESDLDSIMGD